MSTMYSILEGLAEQRKNDVENINEGSYIVFYHMKGKGKAFNPKRDVKQKVIKADSEEQAREEANKNIGDDGSIIRIRKETLGDKAKDLKNKVKKAFKPKKKALSPEEKARQERLKRSMDIQKAKREKEKNYRREKAEHERSLRNADRLLDYDGE